MCVLGCRKSVQALRVEKELNRVVRELGENIICLCEYGWMLYHAGVEGTGIIQAGWRARKGRMKARARSEAILVFQKCVRGRLGNIIDLCSMVLTLEVVRTEAGR